jgi:hypothetical protein
MKWMFTNEHTVHSIYGTVTMYATTTHLKVLQLLCASITHSGRLLWNLTAPSKQDKQAASPNP